MYSLIVVDYNSIEATLGYIRRAWEAMGEKGAGHVVIVQNGEDCLQILCDHYGAYSSCRYEGISQELYRFQKDGQDIYYCHSGENLGYARGNNLGGKIARQIWGDPYYLISNNDLVFEKAVDLSVSDKLFAENPSVGIIGPEVRAPQGYSQSPQKWTSAFRRLILFYWLRYLSTFYKGEAKSRFLLKHCNDVDPDATTGPCDWVSGCFMLLRADAFHNAGMFDEHTFLYGEEMILSRRMERKGYSVWFCRELKVIHNHAQTTKKSIAFLKGLKIDFNAILYYYKTYTNTSSVLLTLAKWNFAIYCFIFRCLQKIKGKSE